MNNVCAYECLIKWLVLFSLCLHESNRFPKFKPHEKPNESKFLFSFEVLIIFPMHCYSAITWYPYSVCYSKWAGCTTNIHFKQQCEVCVQSLRMSFKFQNIFNEHVMYSIKDCSIVQNNQVSRLSHAFIFLARSHDEFRKRNSINWWSERENYVD